MVSPSWIEELKLAPLRRFFRIVIDEGTLLWLEIDPERGDTREGESAGAGSLDFADCTLCSSLCILPIRPRIWFKDSDLGSGDERVELLSLDKLPREEGDAVERL